MNIWHQIDQAQELAAERRAGYGCCPRCGGYPDTDEYGRTYTCYFCCDTGRVPQAVLDAYDQDETDRMQQFLPTRLGICESIPQYQEWDDGDYEQEPLKPGHRLFSRLIPVYPRSAPRVVDLMDDDIPF